MFLDYIIKYPMLFLAPMAGVTDSAFREICRESGADVTVSEMVSAKGLYYKDKKTLELMEFKEKERPIGIQLFGSDPEIIGFAAKKIESEIKPDFIDINMGCPMPKIVNNGDGSALMKSPGSVFKIVEAAVKSVKLPVSVKIRKGFDSSMVNAEEVARAAENAGAAFITVHGRTREQMYSGKADLNIIREVKNSVKIPVIGNGDIFSPESAKNMLKETGCDGLMLARGILGNPFLFSQTKSFLTNGTYEKVSDQIKIETALKQIKIACRNKGERIAIPEARKHMAWYLKGMKNSAKAKDKIFRANEYSEIEAIVADYLENNREI